MNQTNAQMAVNSHFFLPFPSADPNAGLVGFGASQGNIYSAFENPPIQNYAIVSNSPAINIDPTNHASIVTRNAAFADGLHVNEPVTIGNAFSGSAQIITSGVLSVPTYVDASHPDGQLIGPGPAGYSNANSWYNLYNARTAIGLSADNHTLVIFTVDNAGGSTGLRVGDIASIMLNDYGVYNALNMDGGGSTSLALRNPVTGVGALANSPSDATPGGRLVGSSLAIFAMPIPTPGAGGILAGVLIIAARRRR
jgi:hypothetical protein